MIKPISATLVLAMFILFVFMLTCRFLEKTPFGMPAELESFTPPTVISSRL